MRFPKTKPFALWDRKKGQFLRYACFYATKQDAEDAVSKFSVHKNEGRYLIVMNPGYKGENGMSHMDLLEEYKQKDYQELHNLLLKAALQTDFMLAFRFPYDKSSDEYLNLKILQERLNYELANTYSGVSE